MANNTVDFEHLPQIERLKQTLGEAECLRLGFIVPDERGVISLSPVGFGYLIYVEGGVTTPAEAFAAGFQCASDLFSDKD